jgi:hypothetical protein
MPNRSAELHGSRRGLVCHSSTLKKSGAFRSELPGHGEYQQRSYLLFYRSFMMSPARFARIVCVLLLIGSVAVAAWARQAAGQPGSQSGSAQPASPGPSSGSLKGVVMNHEHAVYEGAAIDLSLPAEPAPRHATTDSNGRFVFSGVPAGTFTITASAPGFTTAQITGVLHPGENLDVPAIELSLAATSSEVTVTASRQEIATAEVKIEEKQRVLGVIPNFYVVYDSHPAPLSPRQKFSLAWHDSIDPITFVSAGFFAGIEQAQNTFAGYGQGAEGYAKRYGANYADGFFGDMLGGALFPSLLHQDPRYYYKGKGSIASRALHAVAMSFLCKGDNGHWQFDYSAVAGSLAAGEISNLYYPSSNQNNFSVVLDSSAIGLGEDAIGNLFQEFLVRKLTPAAKKQPAP